MKRLLSVAFMAAALIARAQNWSPPVAVTSGAGDDHNLAFGFLNNWIAWDRTEAGNTDIYAGQFDFGSGVITGVTRLTDDVAVDQKPTFSFMLDPHNGIFYQSNQNGLWAIYYIEQTDSGFSAPWLTLYSDANLYDPIFWPMNTCLGNVPIVFLRSDSAALEFEYGWQEYWEIPLDTAFFVSVENSGAPVFSHSGFYNSSGWVIGMQLVRWAWEIQIGGQTEIEYLYAYPDSSIIPIIYSGLLPNSGYDYHNPKIGEPVITFERESPQGFDIVRSYLDEASGIWSTPELVVPDLGNEQHYSSGAYETDINGNWDIAYWHPYFQIPEIIDDDPAEDRNPMVTSGAGHLNAFWESNRDGTWKIYWSQRDYVGVGPEAGPVRPEKFDISVHPNPGNAQFRISLDLPIDGMVNAAVYDLSGRRVAQIHDGSMAPGIQTFNWNATGNPSGIYLLRVEGGNSVKTQKLVLMK